MDIKTLTDKNNELAKYLLHLLGRQADSFLSAAVEDRAVRFNILKTGRTCIPGIIAENARLEKLLFSPNGYKIGREISSLSHTLKFFLGHFAFQGASSQVPALVLNPAPGEKVLDMAASPGSKATQIGAMMANRGMLVVNDSNLKRMQALNTNTQRTGLINHVIYYLAGERIGRLFPEYFDKVLLDTPCSGLGTLASNPEVISWWSIEKLNKLGRLQKQLIVSAIKAVKVGGEIVYSTCSVAPEENEMIINDVLQKYPVEVLPVVNDGMDHFESGWLRYNNNDLHPSLANCKRIWPHKHNMEGFFVARLRKTATYYNKNNPKNVSYLKTLTYRDKAVSEHLHSISESWGIDGQVWRRYRFIKTSDRIWMLNTDISEIIEDGFTNAGLLLAEEKLNIWKLSHQAVQHFSDKINKRMIALSDAQIRQLFLKGACKYDGHLRGYQALLINNRPAAIVYIENNTVKIKLSQSFHI